MTNQRWAPGHRYNDATQTGIKWTERAIELHARPPQGGPSAIIAKVARPKQLSEWDFWYHLTFAQAFPQVAYWWFGDAWSGRVKASRPAGRQDGQTLFGYVQFMDEETAGDLWLLVDEDPLIISVPLPENHRQPLNLPLQLGVARLVFGALNDGRYADRWLDITSLVARDQLAVTFPTTRAALVTEVPAVSNVLDLAPGGTPDLDLDGPPERVWRLEDHEIPLREALCRLQGLKPA
jgi:hypothetical protein